MTTNQTDDRLPFTCLVPDGPGVEDIYDQTAALHLAVVDRAAAPTLDDTWEAPGTYLLLEPVTADGASSAYVGKAPAGLRQRLMGHVRKTEKWVRAVLIQRDTTHGFNSAHTAWLEGRLYDLVTASASGTLSNSQRPGDDTLAPYDRQMLETTIDPMRRVLRLIGYDPDPPNDDPEPSRRRRTPARHATTLPDILNAGLLSAGVRLVSTNNGYPADAVLNADGSITWDGTMHQTPSAAGAAVRGGKATNGWAFWAIETDNGKVSLATLRSRVGGG